MPLTFKQDCTANLYRLRPWPDWDLPGPDAVDLPFMRYLPYTYLNADQLAVEPATHPFFVCRGLIRYAGTFVPWSAAVGDYIVLNLPLHPVAMAVLLAQPMPDLEANPHTQYLVCRMV